MASDINIKGFAIRVERLCDFFITKLDGASSEDAEALYELKAEASQIELEWEPFTVEGLDNYMRGLTPPPKAEEARES